MAVQKRINNNKVNSDYNKLVAAVENLILSLGVIRGIDIEDYVGNELNAVKKLISKS